MKKTITLYALTFLCSSAFSQLNAKFENDTLIVERDKQNDITVHLAANILGLNPAEGGANNINFSVDLSAATTLPTNGYNFTPFAIPLTAGVIQVDCPVTILRGQNTAGSVLYLTIQLFYNTPAAQIKNTVLKIINKEDKKESEKETGTSNNRNRIMLLNAYNLDFGSTSLSSNYVGHLNLFAPFLSINKRWGFNTGIMKINYAQKDSTSSTGSIYPENVLLSPFDTIKAGLKYLREINSYQSETRNTVWSFYVQPTWEITKRNAGQHIYIHAHLELLASKWSVTSTIKNLKRDTGILGPSFNPLVFRSNINSTNTYSINSLSSYFGGGLTFDLTPWDGGSFFFQTTIGCTSNVPSQSSVDLATGLPNSFIKSGKSTRAWRGFYLVRANYRHVLSKDATVIVGMDIRGLLPLYNPQYAAYVGLNIGLDSILGLIGGKSSN